jgi:hypothetical protein
MFGYGVDLLHISPAGLSLRFCLLETPALPLPPPHVDCNGSLPCCSFSNWSKYFEPP